LYFKNIFRGALFGTSATTQSPTAGGGGASVFGAAPPAAARMMKSMRIEGTAATEQVLSTTFSIAQQKTIPDDGSEHKVGFEFGHLYLKKNNWFKIKIKIYLCLIHPQLRKVTGYGCQFMEIDQLTKYPK
jgi:hypothetical protein